MIAMAVSAPEDRRFRRGRAAPPPRRRRRSGYWTVAGRASMAIGLVVLAGAAARGVAAFASTLRVGRIVVQGNVHLSTGEVLSMLEGLPGDSMLRTDLEAWRQRLRQSPWVADATLSRSLPDAVEVSVVERQPLAVGRLKDQLVLVDAEGVVIDEYGPRYAVFDLPIVDGLAQPSGVPGTALQGPRARLTARLLADLSADRSLLARVSQADVSDPHNAVVWLDGDHARLLIGDRDFRSRLRSYLDLRPSLLARVTEMDYVDLRFGSRIFVRPIGGNEAGAGRRAASGTVRAPS